MLSEVCAEIHNYFCKPENIQAGTFTIEDGSIEPLAFLQDVQYLRIVGSVFNDGVWQYGACILSDEVFTGYIWPMAVPPAVLVLCDDIEDWIMQNQEALDSPYSSESFGGYSYSIRGKSADDSTGVAYGWKDQFSARLRPYRKLREL